MAVSFQRLIPLVALLPMSLQAVPSVAQSAPDQAAEAAALDPESPMAELPDLGVGWPDMAVDEDDSTAPASEVAEVRRYSVELEGLDKVEASEIRRRFDLLSVLRANAGAAANVAQINRRAREDSELLDSILRAEGYYDAEVETRVDGGDTALLKVVLRVATGPLYRFDAVSVTGLESTGETAQPLRDALGVKPGDPVDADAVLGGSAALTALAHDRGFPFATLAPPEIIVDHDTQTARYALAVTPGGVRHFGAILVSGERPPFGARHVARIARFTRGERFDQSRLDDLKRALIATGLLSSVEVTPVAGATPDVADIAVALEPAPLRTIAGEIGYGTGEGYRAEVAWTHRNLIRPEGAVTVRGIAGTREQLAAVLLRQSNFSRRDQVFNAGLQASNINRPAYSARTLDLSAGIERRSNIIWQKKWTWSAGIELITSDESDLTDSGAVARRQTYYIAALPLSLAYDGSDDLLDPKRGFRLAARLSPEASLQKGQSAYVRAQIDASSYFPVSSRLVLAGRLRFGTIAGVGTDNIAPSRRFYAGGGGSVRGYGYQDIGPRDAFGDPMGGRSLAEFSLEARARIGVFGIVPFIDGGNIYTRQYPDFSGLRYGAGVGVRYHSNFGPIRIDVGTPINPRSGDAPITVFVSLGQAF